MGEFYTPGGSRKRLISPGSGSIPSLQKSNLSRVLPRQLSTGSNRGELTVNGLIRITDNTGTTRLIMGYKKDAF